MGGILKINLKSGVGTVTSISEPVKPDTGTGTCLENIFKSIGIHSIKGCSCKKLKHALNLNSKQWIEDNIELILDEIGSNAKILSVPWNIFTRSSCKYAIKYCLWRSSNEEQNSQTHKM